jgi:hypothetical protein
VFTIYCKNHTKRLHLDQATKVISKLAVMLIGQTHNIFWQYCEPGYRPVVLWLVMRPTQHDCSNIDRFRPCWFYAEQSQNICDKSLLTITKCQLNWQTIDCKCHFPKFKILKILKFLVGYNFFYFNLIFQSLYKYKNY